MMLPQAPMRNRCAPVFVNRFFRDPMSARFEIGGQRSSPYGAIKAEMYPRLERYGVALEQFGDLRIAGRGPLHRHSPKALVSNFMSYPRPRSAIEHVDDELTMVKLIEGFQSTYWRRR
jgi:hypothetical protein